MGKSSTKVEAPKPDPLIGQAAQGNIELGRESLAFARQQYEEGKIRQVDLDALTKQVAESALQSQTKAENWAQQDRDLAMKYTQEDRAVSNNLRDKYENYADQDRQLGRDTASYADQLSNDANKLGQQYEKIYGEQAQYQAGFGKEEVDRYKNTFRPVQDRLVSDAMSWDSNDRLESEAGKAKADITANAAQQREAQQRQMASMGVNPNSGRFAGVERATDTLTALGAAGAQNASRDNVRAQGISMRNGAAQLGQQVLANGQQANQLSSSLVGAAQNARQTGISSAMQAKNLGLAAAGVGNTAAGLSVSNQGAGYTGIGSGYAGLSAGQQAGNSAIGATQAGTAGWNATNGVMQNGFGSAMAGNSSGAGIASNLYGQQLNAWGMQQQANAQNNSSFGSAIGSLVGTGASLYL